MLPTPIKEAKLKIIPPQTYSCPKKSHSNTLTNYTPPHFTSITNLQLEPEIHVRHYIDRQYLGRGARGHLAGREPFALPFARGQPVPDGVKDPRLSFRPASRSHTAPEPHFRHFTSSRSTKPFVPALRHPQPRSRPFPRPRSRDARLGASRGCEHGLPRRTRSARFCR